jgi:hypothetical protein
MILYPAFLQAQAAVVLAEEGQCLNLIGCFARVLPLAKWDTGVRQDSDRME